MRRLLLCPPTSYDIEYEINPWMHIQNKVDRERVMKEYQDIKTLYQSLGVTIYEIAQDPTLPDMVYTANIGFVSHNIFIPANFKFEQRRKEAEHGIKFFEKEFGYETKKLPEAVFFEGQGDLLCRENQFFFGFGKRSDYEAKKYLEEILATEIMVLELVDPYYYHLDTCFAPLSKDTVVINPLSFTEKGLETINQTFANVVLTSKIDNALLCCNLVCLEKNLVIGMGISEKLKEDLKQLGYTVHETAMSEYLKGGGSVKCISFEF